MMKRGDAVQCVLYVLVLVAALVAAGLALRVAVTVPETQS